MVKNACDAILGPMLPKNNNVVFVAIFSIISASKPFFGEKKLKTHRNFWGGRNFDRNFCGGRAATYIAEK